MPTAGAFGELLRELRVAATLTQEELAEAAGLSQRGISDLERGARRTPHPATLRRIAAALALDDATREALEAAARGEIETGVSPRVPPAADRSAVWSAPLTSFVGRERERAEVRALLDGNRLVTLTGVGGIGKTRLAGEVVRGVPRASVMVELAALADPTLVPGAVATAVGVREGTVAALAAAVRLKPMLIVLDNCEHLLGACTSLVATLLGACPELRVLATSREPLGIPGEAVWQVPPLGRNDGAHLFAERARAVWPSFELSDATADAIGRVCRRLEGIPLAIELAAARTRVLSLEQIDSRLEDRYRLLGWGPAAAPARHQTLQAAVDWSYALLSDRERLLFDRLAVFRGGFVIDDVESVCAFDALTAADVLDGVQSLVEKSLVVAEPRANGVIWFHLLETLRDYAHARLNDRGELHALRRRHLEHYVALAEHVEPLLDGPEQQAWFEHLEREHDNIRAALGLATIQADAVEHGVRLAASVSTFWAIRGHLAEGRSWIQTLLNVPGELTDVVRGKALDTAGWFARENNEVDQALACHEQALAIFRRLGDLLNVAVALNHLAVATAETGDLARARSLFEESEQVSLQAGVPARAALAVGNLGITARLQGQFEEANGFFLRAAELARENGNLRQLSMVLHSLGNLSMDRGDVAEAAVRFHEALELSLQVGNWASVARCFEGLANVLARQQRDLTQAAQLYGAAAALRDELVVPVTQSGRPKHEAGLARLRDQLGPAAFEAGHREGAALSRADAVRLALAV